MSQHIPTVTFADDPGLQTYLNEDPVGILAVPVPGDEIHIAPMLFVAQYSPFRLIFLTNRGTEKCQLLLSGDAVKAACAVGADKGLKYAYAMQMRGTVQLQQKSSLKNGELEAYEKKFGRKFNAQDADDEIALIFTPNWARYTHYKGERFQDGYNRYYLDLS